MRQVEDISHLLRRAEEQLISCCNLPFLIKLTALILVLVLGWRVASQLAEDAEVKETALQFAKGLRLVEDQSKQARRPLQVKLTPATLQERSVYKVLDGQVATLTVELPDGVSGTGAVKLTPDGYPAESSTFVFYKGTHSVTLEIDRRGVVSFP